MEKPAQETPPPGSDSAVRRFTELGPSPKPEAGWREELGKRALVNTSGPGQCTWNLGGTGPHAPGSCDRCFLDLSGAWATGGGGEGTPCSGSSSLFHATLFYRVYKSELSQAFLK